MTKELSPSPFEKTKRLAGLIRNKKMWGHVLGLPSSWDQGCLRNVGASMNGYLSRASLASPVSLCIPSNLLCTMGWSSLALGT